MFGKKISYHSVKILQTFRSYFILFSLLFLTNCGQYTSMIGPSYTLLESGSVLQATSSYGRTYLLSNVKQNYTDEVNPQRICQEIHSSELRSIFFETQISSKKYIFLLYILNPSDISLLISNLPFETMFSKLSLRSVCKNLLLK